MQRLRANDGVALAVEHFGAADAPTLLFAHGFGQTRHAWSETANALAQKAGTASLPTDAAMATAAGATMATTIFVSSSTI